MVCIGDPSSVKEWDGWQWGMAYHFGPHHPSETTLVHATWTKRVSGILHLDRGLMVHNVDPVLGLAVVLWLHNCVGSPEERVA